jgi:hypothetical protein
VVTVYNCKKRKRIDKEKGWEKEGKQLEKIKEEKKLRKTRLFLYSRHNSSGTTVNAICRSNQQNVLGTTTFL